MLGGETHRGLDEIGVECARQALIARDQHQQRALLGTLRQQWIGGHAVVARARGGHVGDYFSQS